jgi:hypothetical protein
VDPIARRKAAARKHAARAFARKNLPEFPHHSRSFLALQAHSSSSSSSIETSRGGTILATGRWRSRTKISSPAFYFLEVAANGLFLQFSDIQRISATHLMYLS